MTAAARQASPQNTRLSLGDFIADVLIDSRGPEKVYHSIVQRIGSAEILEWTQSRSFEEAMQVAQSYLEYLNRTNEAKDA